MKQYLELLKHVSAKGVEKKDRTGTGTLSVFGYQMRFDLQEGFPLVTTKKCHLRSIIHELLWFLKGETNIQYLNDNGVTIWDEWAEKEDVYAEYELSNADRVQYALLNALWTDGGHLLMAKLNHLGEEPGHAFLDSIGVPRADRYVVKKKGELGPVYGKQWRDWTGPKGEHFDQIQTVMDQLNNDPDSRRIIVSAWNVAELDKMALAPCHSFFQFYTRELSTDERYGHLHTDAIKGYDVLEESMNKLPLQDETYHARLNEYMDKFNTPKRALSCQLYARSQDVFLGTPFNIASYALLIHMVAHQLNMVPDEFVWTGGDTHIYSNHMEQVKEQLTREPHPLPKLKINHKPNSIFEYNYIDFELEDYVSHPAIKAPVAI